MNISEIILSQPAWTTKKAAELPVVGNNIVIYMKGQGKTSLGSKDVLDVAYRVICSVLNFTFYNEFEELMKLQTSMISRSTVQDLLKQYWLAVKDELRTTPLVFELVKNAITHINSSLVDSNSRPKTITQFKSYIIDNGSDLI